MEVAEKLAILAQAARYDVSCSSSGSSRANRPGGLGNTVAGGICHSFAADGRCISLLKILLGNACAWNCAYCGNRAGNDHPRAVFEPQELVELVMGLYRRNYIEGLFLSSAILGDPDRTMERMNAVARSLRQEQGFNGYIHLKAIPGADPRLLAEAGWYADRLSVNIELPTREALARLAPDKNPRRIFGAMRQLAEAAAENRELARIKPSGRQSGVLPAASGWDEASGAMVPGPHFGDPTPGFGLLAAEAPALPPDALYARAACQPGSRPQSGFMPTGQSTQIMVGASPEPDLDYLRLASQLYRRYRLKRVYYSAYVSLNADERLPQASLAPPLLREHRLYQADWLMRFYHFDAEEILDPEQPSLDMELDPKAAWALRHPGFFPVNVQKAPLEFLLRVPGIGPLSARRILAARRSATLREEDLAKLGVVMKRARPFLGFRSSGGADGGQPSRGMALRRLLIDPPGRRAGQASQLWLFP